MSTPLEDMGRDPKTGVVTKVFRDYGFISCADVPDKDVYFKTAWLRDNALLRTGEKVQFDLFSYRSGDGTNWEARNLSRIADDTTQRPAAPTRSRSRLPTSYSLLDWAYLGYLPNVLAELKGLALKGERWEFKNTPQGTDRPNPILYSYLMHTFGRLVLEKKVLVNEQASLAAFNTGLVDPRYEKIYALFSPNDAAARPWRLAGFCIAGEGANGQDLVRHFNPLPSPAHYFDNPVELLYDTRAGEPELDWKHVIIDRIDRYPKEFVEDHWPTGFTARDVSQLPLEDRIAYHRQLGRAIELDTRTYRRIMNRLKDAVDLSIKRVSWNFKTAIPQYYPRVRQLQLLLPICLVSDEHVDMALAVEKTPSGSYLGHTALPLDWAYTNARLICRPDSDWLLPQEIIEGTEPEDEP
jgi:hypothetical protein